MEVFAVRYIIYYIMKKYRFRNHGTCPAFFTLFAREPAPWRTLNSGDKIMRSVSGVHMQRQVITDIRVPNSVWKKKVSDTLYELNIIPEKFSGKVVISFKEGGVSYIERTETLK